MSDTISSSDVIRGDDPICPILSTVSLIPTPNNITCSFCLDDIDLSQLAQEAVIQPCKCRGSMGYVHLKCLTIAISKPYRYKKCTVCDTPYDIEAPPSTSSNDSDTEQSRLYHSERGQIQAVPSRNSDQRYSPIANERSRYCNLTLAICVSVLILITLYMTYSTFESYSENSLRVDATCSYVNNTLYSLKGDSPGAHLAEGVINVNDVGSYQLGTDVYVHSNQPYNAQPFSLNSLSSDSHMYSYSKEQTAFYNTFSTYKHITTCHANPMDLTSICFCNEYNECLPSKWCTPEYTSLSIIITIILWILAIIGCCRLNLKRADY